MWRNTTLKGFNLLLFMIKTSLQCSYKYSLPLFHLFLRLNISETLLKFFQVWKFCRFYEVQKRPKLHGIVLQGRPGHEDSVLVAVRDQSFRYYRAHALQKFAVHISESMGLILIKHSAPSINIFRNGVRYCKSTLTTMTTRHGISANSS